LGSYGVIDERVDINLVAAIADAHAEWQIVMVGPVVKIDPTALPQRQNIHYLGQRPYQELPQFLASWNVALLPFAINESTRFISPTKTLEYMVAELPIVSTNVADVVELYGRAVSLASDIEEFIVACERALKETPQVRQDKVQAMRDIVSTSSWDATVKQMRRLISDTGIGHPKPRGDARAKSRISRPQVPILDR
jgi:glycosyltransferase involved in cell wall biosynthesis